MLADTGSLIHVRPQDSSACTTNDVHDVLALDLAGDAENVPRKVRSTASILEYDEP